MSLRFILRLSGCLACLALALGCWSEAMQIEALEKRIAAFSAQRMDLARHLAPTVTSPTNILEPTLGSTSAPAAPRTIEEQERRRESIRAQLAANPEYQAYLRKDAALRTQLRYGEVFRRLMLPPDRLCALRDTLAVNLSAYEAPGADQTAIKAKNESDVRALLTHEEFLHYSREHDDPGTRYRVKDFATDCEVLRQPLTAKQREQLFDAWAGHSADETLVTLGTSLSLEQQTALRVYSARQKERAAAEARIYATLPEDLRP